MKEELPKRYEPRQFEQRLYELWEKGEYFTPEADRDRPKFAIVMPPPNAAGRLSLGRALVDTLQDIVVRWKRMSGFNTLWLPGTDHAGLATQLMADRELHTHGLSGLDAGLDPGREAFAEKVSEWKVIDQLKRLGASADWTRSRFTLDEGLSRAVRRAFVSLYDDGLIDHVSHQWFVKIEPLARPAIDAVRDGAIRILPRSWETTYFNWMENLPDWTISRRLGWGHRIPAFHCPNGHMTVSETDPASCPVCNATPLTQETDVLDTSFSLALWPFTTMGWPDQTPDFETFYPTDALITGCDTLLFWVARMIMMGLHFTERVPFVQVVLNGRMRDRRGVAASKGKGNGTDPLDVIEELGADAVRFRLATVASHRDILLARKHVEGHASFANKIWNASRFALMHLDAPLKNAGPIERDELKTVERWILSRLNDTTREVNKALSAFRFHDASNTIYRFFRHEFCDWYIEMVKPVLREKHGAEADAKRAKRVLLEVLDRSLRLLHPFMPFITEEIWRKLGGVEPSIMVAPYPIAEEVLEDREAERMMASVQRMITTVRDARAKSGFTPKDRFCLFIKTESERQATFFTDYAYLLLDLARLTEVVVNGQEPAGAHRDAVGCFPIAIEFPAKAIPRKLIERT